MDYEITAATESVFADSTTYARIGVRINGHDAGHYYAIVSPNNRVSSLHRPLGDQRLYVLEGYRSLEEIVGLAPTEIAAATRKALGVRG